MFISNIIHVAIFVSGVWAHAHSDPARCADGFDWVRTVLLFPKPGYLSRCLSVLVQNKNSHGQDPCTVGPLLDASCREKGKSTLAPVTVVLTRSL